MQQTSDSASADGVAYPQGQPAAIGRPILNDRLRDNLWRDALSILILALAAAIFFWPVLAGRAWLPKGGGDSVSFIYPMYRFAADSLRGGTIPFWNPYQYAGSPFLADNQSGIFYPFNLLLFFLWPDFSYRAIEALVVWHFFFAGLAMYICLRLLRPPAPLRRPAAVLGALAFMLSDVFITHIGNLNLIAVAAWLPLAFLGLHRAILADTPRKAVAWAVAGGAALGIATLAGHGQMTFLIAAFLGLYALYHTLVNRRFRAIPLLALLGIFAVALAGVSLFPAAGTLQHTLRAEFDYERSTNYALPIQGLIGLVAPDFFGRGASFWGDWPRVEYGYVGVLTLLLAAAAVAFRPNRQTLFFVLAGVFYLLLALGPATPLYPLLGRLLPTFPFQVPARFVLLLNFCLAILAAIGLDALLDDRAPAPRRARWLLAGTGLAAVVIAVALLAARSDLAQAQPERAAQIARAVLVFAGLAAAGWLLLAVGLRRRLPPTWLAAAAVLLLFIDLYGLGRYVEIDWNDPMPGFAASDPALDYLQADPGLHRIDIVTGAWQPNMPMLEGLFAARGVYNPLQLANYNVYMGSVGFRGSTLYNLLGIKYLVGGKKEPPGDTSFIVPVYEVDPAVTIYLNTRALPRAMVLFNSEVVDNHDTAFEAVHDDGFDPTRVVILEGGQVLRQEPGQATIEVVRYDPNEVVFAVTNDRPAYFVLSDVFHPDWRAEVDGVPTPIEAANYAFRAVYLEPGTHTVTMRFLPSGWAAGLMATGLTIVVLVGLIVWLWRSHVHSPNDLSDKRAADDCYLEETEI
jgi:hypothetical protein